MAAHFVPITVDDEILLEMNDHFAPKADIRRSDVMEKADYTRAKAEVGGCYVRSDAWGSMPPKTVCKRHKIVKPLQVASVRPTHYIAREVCLEQIQCAQFWPQVF